MDEELQDMRTTLSEIGLSKQEQDVFLLLCEYKIAGATLVSHELDIPRQTAYSILKKMADRGILSRQTRSVTEMGLKGGKIIGFSFDKDTISKYVDDQCTKMQQAKSKLFKDHL